MYSRPLIRGRPFLYKLDLFNAKSALNVTITGLPTTISRDGPLIERFRNLNTHSTADFVLRNF